ncbi:MAG: helix-turn-helix domain-containing protein [Rikenellaceae bacterium]
MGRKIELKNDMILVDRESYERMMRKIDTIFDYVSDKLEKYRQREDDRLISIPEVALYLNLDRSTIYRHIKEERLRTFDSGGKRRLRLGDLKVAVESGVLNVTKQRLQVLIDNHEIQLYERADIE